MTKQMTDVRRERHDKVLRDLQDVAATLIELSNDAGDRLRGEMVYETRRAVETASRLMHSVLIRDDAYKMSGEAAPKSNVPEGWDEGPWIKN